MRDAQPALRSSRNSCDPCYSCNSFNSFNGRRFGSFGSGDGRLGFCEAETFPPARPPKPDPVTLDRFKPVAFDQVPFCVDAVVDDCKAAAGLMPDGLELPLAHGGRRRRAALAS